MTLREAKQCRYVNRSALRLKLSEATTLWVKIQNNRAGLLLPSLTVHVVPHLVRKIDLFDGATNRLIAGPAGFNYPYHPATDYLGGYSFFFNAAATQTQALYLRIQTGGLPYAFVRASRADQPDLEQLNQQFTIGMHIGVLGLLSVVGLGAFVATRNRVAGAFTLLLLNLLINTLAGSGFLLMHAWGDSPHFNSTFFAVMFYLRAAAWVYLVQSILAPYTTPHWYARFCWGSYLLVVLMMALGLMGHEGWAAVLVLVFGITVIPIFQMAAIYRTKDVDRTYQRMLLLGYATVVVLSWVALLITLFPIDNPATPILLTRVVDNVTPLMLVILAVSYYRQTTRQLASAQQEGLQMRLGLELERKLRDERKLLIDMLTHELKNPLASINLAVGSLTRMIGQEQTPISRRLRNIAVSVRSMDLVIERCHFMNQLDREALAAAPVVMSIESAIQDVLERFADRHRVAVTAQGHDAFVTDRDFFLIIISNLVENALKYSPKDSEVCVDVQGTSSERGHALTITVSNAIGAQGAPDATLVFSRFYRNPQALNSAGSGVGLYIVQALARTLGGEIEYVGASEQVHFVLQLPELNHHG